jgi:hypothetical protein
MDELVPLADIERVERLVRILEVVFTIFKYLPIIIGTLAGISLILAGLNFLEQSYGWAIFNLVLGLAGVSFVLGVIRPHPEHFKKASNVAH